LNWIDVKQSSGKGKGILSSNGRYQEMCPYQTTNEATGVSYLGINRVGDKTDPWFGVYDNVWENPEAFPPDFRDIYDIDEWYNQLENITGVEDVWAVDIYGNNYGLYKDYDHTKFYDRMTDSTGNLYVRGAGAIKSYSEFFNVGDALLLNEFNGDAICDMNVYNDILVLEDDTGAVLIHRIVYRDGGYIVKDGDMVSTALLGNQYKSFGRCFDDRSNKLYVGVYNTDAVDGFFEFIIYEYDDFKLTEVYNSSNDDSDEIESLKDEFSFDEIIGATSLAISEMDDTLHLTFIGIKDGGSHIVNIPFIMSGGMHIDEISVVKPVHEDMIDYSIEYAELLHLITTAIYDNKLTIMLEGSETGNKYLQVINL
jgi:ribosome modulation factor